MSDSVLVLGAGELGLAVLEALAAHPKRSKTKISVLLREATLDSDAPPEKKKLVQQLKELNIGFEGADIVQASKVHLAGIMANYGTVVSCNGMGLPSGTQIKLSEAVLAAGVKRYFPWQFGMDYDIIGEGSSQDLFDEQLQVRKMLRAQDKTEWTIVSTGLFMSFLFVAAFGVVDVEARQVRALGSWDNRITASTPTDIGRVTADLILDPRGIKNQVVYTAGDTVTYAQVADAVDKHLGDEKFTRTLWDLEELQKQKQERPDDTMVKYRDTFAQGRGVAWDLEDTVNYERKIQTMDLTTFIKEIVSRS